MEKRDGGAAGGVGMREGADGGGTGRRELSWSVVAATLPMKLGSEQGRQLYNGLVFSSDLQTQNLRPDSSSESLQGDSSS